jgi:DSF synthase
MSMYAVSDAHSAVRADSVAPVPPKLPVDPWLIDLKKSADARRLFELEQLDVSWDDPTGALWTFMRPRGRPSYNLDLLEDFHAWQRGIIAAFENRPNDLRFLLLGSRTPGVFNLGGDLDLFAAKIRDRDRQALVAYGESCVRILHRNMNCLGLPMVTRVGARGCAGRRLRVAALVQRDHRGT